MDTLFVFGAFFVSLLYAIYSGFSLLYPLLLGLAGFLLLSLRRGHRFADVCRMMLRGSSKSLIVIRIFVLIGAITAVWRASGTVSFIVYYGLLFMNAQYFILIAFLLSCAVSFLLGTSFGTVGTIGIVLIVMAKSGGVDPNVAAGAIIAGAYFGDRCSPMSSSANLVAALTGTDLYTNIRNMFRSSMIPLAASIIAYGLLSLHHPLKFAESSLSNDILRLFDVQVLVFLPALIVLLAAVLKIDVKLSMGVSILAGVMLGIFVQHRTLPEMLQYILTGYALDAEGAFPRIIQGGGLSSMVSVALIVLISSAFAGIFEGTGLLRDIEGLLGRLSRKLGVYPVTALSGTLSAAFACNQTLAVIMTHQFMRRIYTDRKLGPFRLALDLENTVIVISALVPWNIAGAFPAAALSADASFIPYAFYLFLVPLANFAQSRRPEAEG